MSAISQLRRGALRHMADPFRVVSSPRLALDRASGRRLDQDGHLHVASSIISAAQVNPYYGREIDLDGTLGLQADRTYQILRDPQELAKAAASFANKPLLIEHRPQFADDFDHDLVVGSVANPVWDAPTLKAELVIWDNDAIRAVQDGSQCALSCGYRFDVDMTPGTYLGQRYDGRFINLRGNHVALVPDGRVTGAMVGDQSLKQRSILMATDDNGDDLYNQLINFLATKLETSDLQKVIELLGNDDDTTVGDDVDRPAGSPLPGGGKVPGKPATAMDRARATADFHKRFPDAKRLAKGY